MAETHPCVCRWLQVGNWDAELFAVNVRTWHDIVTCTSVTVVMDVNQRLLLLYPHSWAVRRSESVGRGLSVVRKCFFN